MICVKDLTDDIKFDYLEASLILNKSPRGAAALLRLCIQKICLELNAKGKTINENIADLVSKGMPVKVKQALDTLRVIGNDAVHPGVINLNDNLETALKLFKLVNLIAYHFITEPQEVEQLFNSLPEKAKDSIKKRDSK